MSSSTHPPVILITGCSSGFGRMVATEALSRGLRVIATARRPETIADLRTKGAETLSLDITSDQKTLENFASNAIKIHGQIDILVNNAGYLQIGAMEEVSPEQLRAVFETNFFGTVNITTAILPHFRERRTGLIVNISSVSAFSPFPGMGIYGTTKAALDSASKAWGKELAPFNVRSVSINPGRFRTSIGSVLKTPSREIDAYSELHKGLEWYRANAGKEPGDPQKAARKILDAITSNEELPARLVLGDNAILSLEADVQAQVKNMERWREFGKGTNVDPED
ncbi:hypothetical protein AAF712_011325 [Marasmius tenuissimus]|uniref:Ketoreductase domain-containing protein n=1 Tax=Marasmius tenuissimus TaxID=585030 RepID=A0ABR2ZKW3_9AGAR